VIASARGRFSGPGFRTPPTFPGSLPGITAARRSGLGGFRTPPFVKTSLLSTTSSFFALAQQQSACGRFVDRLVKRVEDVRRDRQYRGANSLEDSMKITVGEQLIGASWTHSKRLGTQPFDGFRRELTDGNQNDGVYQHVTAHAGATMIGDRHLLIPYKGGVTGGKWASTGTELTTYALQEDERQRDDPLLQDRRAESEAEIRDDHAGRQVGGHMMRGVSGELDSGGLRQTLFGILCQF
jgi:hypothetical protein